MLAHGAVAARLGSLQPCSSMMVAAPVRRRPAAGAALLRLRHLAAATSATSTAGDHQERAFVDIVWMHNGWDFLVPMMQKRLDLITSHRCVIRQATYDDHARLELSSLTGARVLVPAMAAVTPEALDAAGPGLELVYQPAVDTSRINTAACAERGIPACNSPGSNANALAESIVMLMLALARDLPGGIDRCLNPPDGWGGPAGTELRGTTLGIIGDTGHSGALLKTICGSGFGMTVRGTSSKSSRAEFEAMLAESDFLSINCVLNDSTRNLLSDAEFALMKEGAILINCARAGIVDRSALEAALDSGRLRGAGIDVHWEEPCEVDDPLLRRPNVIGTPHLGASTQQFFDNVSELLRVNVEAILAGDKEALQNRMV